MKKEAERKLSEPVLVAIRVTPLGLVNAAAMKGAAGSLGGIAGAALQHATSNKNIPSGLGPKGYRKAMFLAVTSTRVAFFAIDIGITARLGELIAEYPRSDIKSCSTGRGQMQVPFFMTRPIYIETAKAGNFSLETLTPVFLRRAVLRLTRELQPPG